MKKIALSILAAIVVVQVILVDYASAATVIMGRQASHGYFSGVPKNGALDQVVNSYKGCKGIIIALHEDCNEVWTGTITPDRLQYHKDRFINAVLDLYRNGGGASRASDSNQNKLAGAFLINVMMGNNAPGWGRNPSEAQIQQWKDRINQPNIGIEVAYMSASINSGYYAGNGSTTNDEIFYNQNGAPARRAVVFYNLDTKQQYSVIKLDCANPLGGNVGIPAFPSGSYSLTPTASVPAIAQPGQQVTFTYNVTNTGNTPSDPNTQWWTSENPAGHPYNPAGSLTPGVHTVGTEPFTIPSDATPGSQYCRSVAVTPSAGTPAGPVVNSFVVSQQACVTVARFPISYFDGADVWAGGQGAQSSIFSFDGTTYYGGNTQYGLISNGPVETFGSGGQALRPETGAGGGLIHSNTSSTSGYGNAGMSAPGSVDAFLNSGNRTQTPVVGTVTVDISKLPAGTDIYYAGSVNITASSPIPANTVIRIHTTGPITIIGDIVYAPGPYDSLASLPLVSLLSDSGITIAEAVTRVDGDLITKGNLYTCDKIPTGTQSTEAVCGKQLVVNGATIANRLYLRRTYTDLQQGDRTRQAAERFNFSANSFLAPYIRSGSSQAITTVYEQELPPRY